MYSIYVYVHIHTHTYISKYISTYKGITTTVQYSRPILCVCVWMKHL